MLNLYNTTDKLQLVTGQAVTVDVVACFVDLTVSGGAFSDANRQLTAISTVAATDIVAAPAAGKVRNVKTLHIRNKHATSSVDVTVVYDANGTDYEIHKVQLLAGEALEYVEGIGFFTLKNQALLNRTFRVSSDVVNATTSFADITGLTCPLLSGKHYSFLAALIHVNDASTTGSRFGYNIGAAPTTSIVGTIDTVTPSVTASAHSAGVITARDTAVTAQTTGSTSQRLAMIAGSIQPSADGTFAMRCASEVAVAAGLTVKAGSWLHIWEPTG